LDRESINPRFQAFEKFISGMYLGEITRNVILALVDAAPMPVLFGGKATDVINKHYGLDSAVMSNIEEAWGASDELKTESTKIITPTSLSSPRWESSLSPTERARLQRVREVLVAKLGFAPADVSLRDAAIVRRVVTMVAVRAAKLSGCAVAATLVQTERAVLGGGPSPSPRKGEETKIGVGVDGRLALPSSLGAMIWAY
jgi:hexokinase